MGCYEVSLGDTVGTGNPTTIEALLRTVLDGGIPASVLAVRASLYCPSHTLIARAVIAGPLPRHVRHGGREHPHVTPTRPPDVRFVRRRARRLSILAWRHGQRCNRGRTLCPTRQPIPHAGRPREDRGNRDVDLQDAEPSERKSRGEGTRGPARENEAGEGTREGWGIGGEHQREAVGGPVCCVFVVIPIYAVSVCASSPCYICSKFRASFPYRLAEELAHLGHRSCRLGL